MPHCNAAQGQRYSARPVLVWHETESQISEKGYIFLIQIQTTQYFWVLTTLNNQKKQKLFNYSHKKATEKQTLICVMSIPMTNKTLQRLSKPSLGVRWVNDFIQVRHIMLLWAAEQLRSLLTDMPKINKTNHSQNKNYSKIRMLRLLTTQLQKCIGIS